MIAKTITVKAQLTENIIPVSVDFISLLPVTAQIVNPLTEGKVRLQEKEITPTSEEQEVDPNLGYAGLKKVIVHKIPSNYGLVTWNGSVLSIT